MTEPIVNTTAAPSMRSVTKSMEVDQTRDIFSDSTQKLVLIIAISILAICSICCCIMFCDYYMNHRKFSKQIEIAKFMCEAHAIPENVKKEKGNLNHRYLKDNNQKQAIEIVNEAEKSDKDEELYDNGNIVPTATRMTNECGHSDEYNVEGVSERIEYECQGNTHSEGKKGLFENIAQHQQKAARKNGITNITATDGADDPGFV